MDQEAVARFLTRQSEAYGMPRAGLDAIKTQALIRIPVPPEAYVEMRVVLHGLADHARDTARDKFFQRLSDFAGEVKKYQAELLRIRNHNLAHAEYALATNQVKYSVDKEFGENFDPIERIIEPGEDHATWMLLVDFDFLREKKRLKRQKIFIRLRPERFYQ